VICSLFFARQAASLLGRACIVKALQRGQPDLRAGNFVAERAANLGLPVDIVGLSSTSPDAAIRHATWDRFSQALCRPTSRRETSLGRTSSCGPDSTAPSQCWQRHLALSSTDLAATSRHNQHWLREFDTYFPDPQFNSKVYHQIWGLQEYFIDRRPNSGTILLIFPTSTQGECVITTMLWDTSPN
jgi:hypothetical protein